MKSTISNRATVFFRKGSLRPKPLDLEGLNHSNSTEGNGELLAPTFTMSKRDENKRASPSLVF